MEKFTNLYDFIDFAKTNRKYPQNTANNLKSAVKIFEKELNAYELKSIDMVEQSIEEIFRSVVMANKNKSILSLNTYKARLLKVITDYKRYGMQPGKIQNWTLKTRKAPSVTVSKDKTDKENINLSDNINTPVENAHRIEFCLKDGQKAVLFVPRQICQEDAKTIKSILDSLIS